MESINPLICPTGKYQEGSVGIDFERCLQLLLTVPGPYILLWLRTNLHHLKHCLCPQNVMRTWLKENAIPKKTPSQSCTTVCPMTPISEIPTAMPHAQQPTIHNSLAFKNTPINIDQKDTMQIIMIPKQLNLLKL